MSYLCGGTNKIPIKEIQKKGEQEAILKYRKLLVLGKCFVA
jgi:hypothetical protein